MKKYICLFAVLVVFCQQGLSQQIVTSIQAKDVISVFSQSEIQWAIPVSQTEKITLQWYERKSSFSEKEGIRSFVGYDNDHLKASLSIRGNNILAEVSLPDGNVHISTNEQGFLVLHIQKKHLKCGACTDGTCAHNAKDKEVKAFARLANKQQTSSEEKSIANRDVLFVYRLAMPVSYSYFSDANDIFKSKIENVKQFWADAETKLNEIYTREVGVKFEIVNDERLIIQTATQAPEFDAVSANTIIQTSTKKINDLIGEKSYDLGIVITNSFTKFTGLTHLSNAYFTEDKGNATSYAHFDTIVHEIGHMFGTQHTFTTGGTGTYYTEISQGQSVMSYGAQREVFFSLVSIHFIREKMAPLAYYEDKAFTKLIKNTNVSSIYTNFPFGIKIPNQVPVIDQNKLKKEYKLPQYTNFQFYITASDPDDDKFLYMAHPADINKNGHAKFYTYKGTTNNMIAFQPSYKDNGSIEDDTKHFVKEGDFTFWLGVNDANLHEEKPIKYDLYETKVKVIPNSQSFEITSNTKQEYKVGERVTLKWRVDNTIFDTNSKVRILLSDDLGKTFKHTIMASTENDGEYEFTIPNILVGETEFGKEKKINLPAGVFKVEVIDHIAFATTNMAPYKLGNGRFIKHGGFKIIHNDNTLPPLEFISNLPQNVTVSCGTNVPQKENLQVTGGCNPKVEVTDVIKNQTCANSYMIERTYTASDTCGSSPITHKQIITIKDDVKPTFTGTLPTDITIKEGESIPAQAELIATDNCTQLLQIVKNKEEITENGNKVIIYKWEATDQCGNKAEHTQRIIIQKSSHPTPPVGGTPPTGTEPIKEMIVYNGVSTESGSENYLKFEPIENYKNLQIEIFNELGQKVYESKNYQKNGEVFRGYANVKGVFRKGKRLPTGTYFYILKYQDVTEKLNTKQGYLFVR